MKTKYIPILVALLIGAQSTFACEFCGVKNAPHGLALSLALSAFSDTHGITSLENCNNPVEEQGNSTFPEGGERKEEEEGIAEIQPLYLVGENHFNLVDQGFIQEVRVAAGLGDLFYCSEGIHYEEDENGVPVQANLSFEAHRSFQTYRSSLYGTEDSFAFTVTKFIILRSSFNYANVGKHNPDALELMLNYSIFLVNQMIKPSNEAFTAALYTSEALQDNSFLKWIVMNKDELLVKDAGERDQMLWDTFEPPILSGYEPVLGPIKSFLDQAIPLLLVHASTLPEYFQIPQQYLSVLMNLDMLDYEDVCKKLAYWRDFFIIENLKKLHAYANNSGLPIVVIFGAAHIEHIREGLHSAGLTVTSDIQDLPISESIKEAKQERIKEGKFDV